MFWDIDCNSVVDNMTDMSTNIPLLNPTPKRQKRQNHPKVIILKLIPFTKKKECILILKPSIVLDNTDFFFF